MFLDFDGVLRRSSSPLYVLEKDCLLEFERAIRALQGVEIVITSSWREGFTLAELKKPFSPDISARIRGVTPIAQEREDYYRHREVLAYLKRSLMEGRPWVAIDDDPLHYPPSVNVILIDPAAGFDAHASERLRAAVAAEKG